MSEMQQVEMLRFDLADRLAKSLRVSDTSVADMAAALDVHRNTISRYLHGRGGAPDRRTLIVWAMRTGVPLAWLETGELSGDDDDPEGLPWTGSDGHKKPSGYLSAQVMSLRDAGLLDAA